MKTIGKIVPFTNEPCSKHKPTKLAYGLAWFYWVAAHGRKAKQTQCKDCGRWYFKEEM
ncbi:MAG: hypothetical protein WKF87_22580 [Chryseolinea sp.]